MFKFLLCVFFFCVILVLKSETNFFFCDSNETGDKLKEQNETLLQKLSLLEEQLTRQQTEFNKEKQSLQSKLHHSQSTHSLTKNYTQENKKQHKQKQSVSKEDKPIMSSQTDNTTQQITTSKSTPWDTSSSSSMTDLISGQQQIDVDETCLYNSKKHKSFFLHILCFFFKCYFYTI